MKKDIKLDIKPENQMDPEKIASFEDWKKGNVRPIIELTEDMSLLYITCQNMSFLDTNTDFMASVIYDDKTKTIEMRGRMRFESTGRKTSFSSKKPEVYSPISYELMKDEAKSIPLELIKDHPQFELVDPVFELEFSIDEDMESIIKKLNDSDRFNIGTVDQK